MPTLTTYRRDAAEALGLLDVVTTTLAPTGEAAEEQVIAAVFGDASAQTLYENAWVYPTTGAQAGAQRRVRTGGLSPGTETLWVTRGWDAPLAAGTTCELLQLIPAVAALGRSGWREIVNSVLRDTPTIRRHPITAQAGTVRYVVPIWLEAEDQAIGIYGPEASTEAGILSSNLKSIRYDGEQVELELWSGYAVGSVFSLAAYQPTASRIKSAGVWAESTVGLVEDDDEALAPRTLVRALSLVRAAELELQRPDPRYKGLWERALLRWTPIAAGLRARMVPKRPAPTMTVGAPAASGWPKGLFP